MLRSLTSAELGEWVAYYGVDPWGEERADWRTGMMASVIANVNRDPKKRRSAYQPRDFMPFARRPEENPEVLTNKIISAFQDYEARRKAKLEEAARGR